MANYTRDIVEFEIINVQGQIITSISFLRPDSVGVQRAVYTNS